MDVPAKMRDGKMAGNHVLKCYFQLVAFVVFLYRNGDVPIRLKGEKKPVSSTA